MADKRFGLSNLDAYQDTINQALEEMDRDKVIARIWDHDHTVWKPDPTEITNRLGWLRIAKTMQANFPRLDAMVQSARADGFTHALLLGMGGSSLAPEVFHKTFGVQDGFLELAVLDSTDPGAVLSYAEQLDPDKTLFIVTTKSGGTVETLSFFKFFYNRVAAAVGEGSAGAHFIAITDPGSKLEEIARRYQFRETFLNDPNIGGRYSALSYFGLIPAALIGIDINSLLEQALVMAGSCGSDDPPAISENPGAVLGAIMGELAKAGRDKITLILSPAIRSFGDWVEQLIAESTGKEGKGILPIVGEEIGMPGVYGADRLFVNLKMGGDDSYDNPVQALEDAGRPLLRLHVEDLNMLGGQFFLWEMATAIAGYRMGINPFDQPNVESAKALTRQMVAAYQKEGQLPQLSPTLVSDHIRVYGDVQGNTIEDVLMAFLAQAEPGAYITLQAYLQPTPETRDGLAILRTRLRDHTKLAVTSGYGPRFLHSTGQLHKGDAGLGLFIQLIAEDTQDGDIPDIAGSSMSSMSFGVLKLAQAWGDRQALLSVGRKVLTFYFENDAPSGIACLYQAVG